MKTQIQFPMTVSVNVNHYLPHVVLSVVGSAMDGLMSGRLSPGAHFDVTQDAERVAGQIRIACEAVKLERPTPINGATSVHIEMWVPGRGGSLAMSGYSVCAKTDQFEAWEGFRVAAARAIAGLPRDLRKVLWDVFEARKAEINGNASVMVVGAPKAESEAKA
jgi:hypothetical protein